MYYNVFGEKVSRARYREMLEAAKNRRELIAAGLTSRRDLFKMGLLTAGNAGRQDRLEFARLRSDRERRDKPTLFAQQSAGQPTNHALH